jgi:hypothetical protein
MAWFVPLEIFRLDAANAHVAVAGSLALDILLPNQVGLHLRAGAAAMARGDDRAPVRQVVMCLVSVVTVRREIAIGVRQSVLIYGVGLFRGRFPGLSGIVICPRHRRLSKP